MYTGLPVRTTLLGGNKDEGIKICGFTNEKPVIMIMGGSQGSVVVNGAVREALPELQNDFNLCHICGKGNLTADAQNAYKQFEYVTDELPHLFAATDLFIGRSGATTLFELLALKKASLLIPLATGASRGDQILNARSFKKQGFSEMLLQENLNASTLVEYCKKTYEKRLDMIHAIELSNVPNGVSSVVEVLESI